MYNLKMALGFREHTKEMHDFVDLLIEKDFPFSVRKRGDETLIIFNIECLTYIYITADETRVFDHASLRYDVDDWF